MKVFIVASLTADGFLARDQNDFSPDWTSPEDTKSFVELTKRAGVVVMGSRTFATLLKAGRRMPGRRLIVYSRKGGAYKSVSRKDPTEITSEAPGLLVKRLATEGYKELAICGGGMIYDLFLRAGVVDELYLTVEPKLFGNGLSLLADSLDTDLKLLACRNLNQNTIRLHYQVVKK